MTHAELVKRAASWLRNRVRCSVVCTEMASAAREEPDVIGWDDTASHVIECKTSLADFRGEKRKPWRRADAGMGNVRWYFIHESLADKVIAAGLPHGGWGLAVLYTPGRVYAKRPAPYRNECDWRAECKLLLSCLRRVGGPGAHGISVRLYTIESPAPRATLGIQPEDT